MSLTGRFSALFLATSGVMLAAFSLALDVAARVYLGRQVAERVSAALDVLAAAAEIHPEGVEWEPDERLLPLGRDKGDDELRWMIFDDRGRRVDQSINLEETDLTTGWAPRPGGGSHQFRLDDRRGRAWRAGQRRLLPGRSETIGSRVVAERKLPPPTDPPILIFPALDLMAFTPLEPAGTTLTTLRWFLVVLVAAIWLVAAASCRRLSRRALAPLRGMVASARELDAADPSWSLEEAGTGDELDELGRAFNDLLARLHLAYERQRAFSGDASHQLRTPLTVLIGQIEVALRKERSAEEYRRVLNAALGRAMQLARVTETLLFLAHPEVQATPPDAQGFDLDRWAADQVTSLAGSGPAGYTVRHVPACCPLPVHVDPMLLGQLLENLLDNARKYAGPGLPVVVETAFDGRFAVLAVEDSGPGIAPADADRVFEPFFRSPQSRSRSIPGAGLGLAVVRRVATVFGGTAHVRETSGKGCRIEVRIPLADDPQPSDAALAAGQRCRSWWTDTDT